MVKLISCCYEFRVGPMDGFVVNGIEEKEKEDRWREPREREKI